MCLSNARARLPYHQRTARACAGRARVPTPSQIWQKKLFCIEIRDTKISMHQRLTQEKPLLSHGDELSKVETSITIARCRMSSFHSFSAMVVASVGTSKRDLYQAWISLLKTRPLCIPRLSMQSSRLTRDTRQTLRQKRGPNAPTNDWKTSSSAS